MGSCSVGRPYLLPVHVRLTWFAALDHLYQYHIAPLPGHPVYELGQSSKADGRTEAINCLLYTADEMSRKVHGMPFELMYDDAMLPTEARLRRKMAHLKYLYASVCAARLARFLNSRGAPTVDEAIGIDVEIRDLMRTVHLRGLWEPDAQDSLIREILPTIIVSDADNHSPTEPNDAHRLDEDFIKSHARNYCLTLAGSVDCVEALREFCQRNYVWIVSYSPNFAIPQRRRGHLRQSLPNRDGIRYRTGRDAIVWTNNHDLDLRRAFISRGHICWLPCRLYAPV